MAVTIPVSLTPAEEAALVARAEAEGVSVNALLHRAVVGLISASTGMGPTPLTADEWDKQLGDLQLLPDGRIVISVLPNVALTPSEARRELIARGLDRWIAADLVARVNTKA